MPLNTPILQSSLASFFSSLPPGDDAASARAQCAAEWAGAMQVFAVGVVPASTTVAAAAAALEAQLVAVFNSDVSSILAGMEAAFATFAATVAAGMAPAFVATPPLVPVGFSTLATPAIDSSAAATTWSSLLETWMKLGLAVPSGGGGVVGWV